MLTAHRALWPVFLVLSLGSGCSSDRPVLPSSPHVFLITADSLRADHLSLNGYPRKTSPHLDDFARGAWNFRQAITCIPKTGPSLVTYFTGRHPQEHGVRFNFQKIPDELPLLAERMQAAGYTTHAFVSNQVLDEGAGYARGFVSYDQVDDGKIVWRLNRVFRRFAAAHDWSTPTFVWIHYLDPHGPYKPPKKFEEQFLADGVFPSEQRVSLDWKAVLRENASPNKILGAIPMYQQRADGEDRVAAFVARYDAEIRLVDEAFGDVIAQLEELALLDPSWVVFASDHGESLGEHDFWFEHGWFAYEPTLHVPLFVKEPGQTRGRVVERLVSNLDLLPTLAARIEGLERGQGSGSNLLSADAEGVLERKPVVVENSDNYPDKYFGLRAQHWKFLQRESDGYAELYDLELDPKETRNLADDEPERVARLRAELEQRLGDLRAAAFGASAKVEHEPELLERLRQLGYTE